MGAAMLRASTHPGGLEFPESLAAEGPDAAARQAAWLADVWRRPSLRAALNVASPALASQVDALVSAREPDAGQVHRAVVSMVSYLLRWERRATPFGLFAGVGLARIGGMAQTRWTGHRVQVRADAGWLGGIVSRLHECRELLDRLPVVAADPAVVRGDRLTAPGPPPDAKPLELAPVEVSVRCTAPVRAALGAAREPVPFGKLVRQLAADFPTALPERIGALASELVTQGFLMSDLRAPMTSIDALEHACDRLRETRADEIPQVADLVRELTAIDGALQAARAASAIPGEPVATRMRMLSQAVETPLLVDTAMDCDIRIPGAVAQEAADAAGVLHRVTPYPNGYPAWADYHQRFLDRYGLGALMPVADLIADSGLGFPAGYLGSAREPAPRKVTRRDEVLLALVQHGMADSDDEIVLTDRVIADLSDGGDLQKTDAASRAEIAVEIRAVSLEALRRGRFTLMVTGVPRADSSMIGRHAHLLPDDDRDLIASTFAECEPGTVPAQLSFTPRKRRNENVARTCQLLPTIIPVGEHRDSNVNAIPFTDLAVTADETKFFFVRLSTGQRIEPRVTHALEAGVHTPPLARFLAEITTARCAAYKAFDFGVAARMPYLPRVRYRRTILSPARWLLSARDLPGSGVPPAEWDKRLHAWRTRWRVPDHVAIVEHDRRQPIDLRHPVHRMILRARLQRADQLELREASAPEDFAWLGRAHELVLPLARTCAEEPTTPAVRRTLTARPDASHLPGRAGILYAQVYGHPVRFDEVLTGHLPRLITALGDRATGWWFSREHTGHDDDLCLGIYLALASAEVYGDAAKELAVWGEALRDHRLLTGLTLGTYEPKTWCYGHEGSPDGAHSVFAADSEAALAQLIVSMRTDVDRRALAAASMADMATGFAESPDEGMGWLLRALPQEHVRVDLGLREQALRLASAHGELVSRPCGADVIAAWKRRAAALDAYRSRLAGTRDPVTVLRALMESQTIRSVGIGSSARQEARYLVRACALRYLATRAAT